MTESLPDLATARRWWAAHGQRVAEALPVVVGAHTYLPAYAALLPARLEAAERMPAHLVEVEILRDLRQLRAAIAAQGVSQVNQD